MASVEWNCAFCTCLNSAQDTVCSICQRIRPQCPSHDQTHRLAAYEPRVCEEALLSALNAFTPLPQVLQQLVVTHLQGPTLLFVACGTATVRAVSLHDFSVRTFVGKPDETGDTDGKGADARFEHPWSVVADPTGGLFVGDGSCIRHVAADGAVSTWCGQQDEAGYAEGSGWFARFNNVGGFVWVGSALVVADRDNHCIRSVHSNTASTQLVAGCPQHAGFADGAATDAQFNEPDGVTVDAEGNIFVADTGNHCIRMISANGVVKTLAGCPERKGYKDGPAAHAQFNHPCDVCLDGCGNILVADAENDCIRSVNLRTHAVRTLACRQQEEQAYCEGTSIVTPWRVVVDGERAFVSCSFAGVIRCVNLSTGRVSPVCGLDSVEWEGTEAFRRHGDGTAQEARLCCPIGLALV